jgi:hypothetical protein
VVPIGIAPNGPVLISWFTRLTLPLTCCCKYLMMYVPCPLSVNWPHGSVGKRYRALKSMPVVRTVPKFTRPVEMISMGPGSVG